MQQYYVYIMTNRSRTLYTGMTNDLKRRVDEHKRKLVPDFTYKYNRTRLVYYEATNDVKAAIAREKTNQRLASGKENSLDRVCKPKLG